MTAIRTLNQPTKTTEASTKIVDMISDDDPVNDRRGIKDFIGSSEITSSGIDMFPQSRVNQPVYINPGETELAIVSICLLAAFCLVWFLVYLIYLVLFKI